MPGTEPQTHGLGTQAPKTWTEMPAPEASMIIFTMSFVAVSVLVQVPKSGEGDTMAGTAPVPALCEGALKSNCCFGVIDPPVCPRFTRAVRIVMFGALAFQEDHRPDFKIVACLRIRFHKTERE